MYSWKPLRLLSRKLCRLSKRQAGLYGPKAIVCDRVKGSNRGEYEMPLGEGKENPIPRTGAYVQGPLQRYSPRRLLDGLPVDAISSEGATACVSYRIEGHRFMNIRQA
jgi:hypothetical protein